MFSKLTRSALASATRNFHITAGSHGTRRMAAAPALLTVTGSAAAALLAYSSTFTAETAQCEGSDAAALPAIELPKVDTAVTAATVTSKQKRKRT